MIRFIFLIFHLVSIHREYAFELTSYPYEVSDNKVQIVNMKNTELYKQMDSQVQDIWQISKELFATYSVTENPVIVFEEFNQNLNEEEWRKFQEQWLELQGQSGEKPFNSKYLPAYYYQGTPYIQMRPSYLHEGITSAPLLPKVYDTNHGFYTVGHELLHFILDQIGVDIKLHHCLMLESRVQGESSLNKKLYKELLKRKMIQNKASIILDLEKRMFPCRDVSDEDLGKIHDFLETLP